MPQVRYEFIFDDKGIVTGVEKIDAGLSKTEKTAKTVEAASGTMTKSMAFDLGHLGSTAKTTSDSISTAFSGVMSTLKSVGVVVGALEVAHIFKQAIGDALEFQDKMANVNSILGNSSVSSRQLGGDLLQLGGEFGSASELADAMYEAIGAGVKPAESIQFVTEATKLAKATLADTGDTAKLLAVTMNAYGLTVKDVAHISDVFSETVASGIVRGEELAHELGTVIPTAAQLGVSIEEVAAAIATMTRTGINASESTTALNQALLSFIDPSKEAQGIAKELGIDLSINAIHTKGFAGALSDLKEKVGTNDQALIALFGNVRAGRAALALTGEQAGFFTLEVLKMATAVGVTDEAFRKQNDTINRQLAIAYNTLGNAATGFLNDTSDQVAVSDLFTLALKKMNHELQFELDLIRSFSSFVTDTLQASYTIWTGRTSGLEGAIEKNNKRMWEAAMLAILGAKNLEEYSDQNDAAGEAAEKFAKEVEALTKQLRPNSHEVTVLEAALKKLDGQGVSSAQIVEKFGDKTIEARLAMIEMGKAVPHMVNQTALDAVLQKAATAQKNFNDKALEDFRKSQDAQLEYSTKIAEQIMADRVKTLEGFEAAWAKAMAFQVKEGEAAEAAIRGQLDDSLKYNEFIMKSETDFRKSEIELQLKTMDERAKQEREIADSTKKVWEDAAGEITADLAKAFTDVIFHGGNFKDSMVSIAKETAEGMFNAFLVGLLAPLTTRLTKLGADLADQLMGGGLLGKIPGIGGLLGGGTAAAVPSMVSPEVAQLGTIAGGATLSPGGVGGSGAASGILGAAAPFLPILGAGLAGFIAIHQNQDKDIADLWTPYQTQFDQMMAASTSMTQQISLAQNYLGTMMQFAGQHPPGSVLVTTQALETFMKYYGDPEKYGVRMELPHLDHSGFPPKAVGGSFQTFDPNASQMAEAPLNFGELSLREFYERAWATQAAADAMVPSYAVGTPYVPTTGLALVHQGERIMTASENRQLSLSGHQGITISLGGVNITQGERPMSPEEMADFTIQQIIHARGKMAREFRRAIQLRGKA